MPKTADSTNGSCFPSKVKFTGFCLATARPHTKMLLVLLLSGLGSVENMRLYLAAKRWQVSSMICIASLVGAKSSRSSQKPSQLLLQRDPVFQNTLIKYTKRYVNHVNPAGKKLHFQADSRYSCPICT